MHDQRRGLTVHGLQSAGVAIKPGSHQREPALQRPSCPSGSRLTPTQIHSCTGPTLFPEYLTNFAQNFLKNWHMFIFFLCVFFLIVPVHWATLLNTAPGVLWWWCYCLCPDTCKFPEGVQNFALCT